MARVFNDTVGVSIMTYDKSYLDESGVVHSYLTDGYVAFLPDGVLGNQWFGTTPEEADLRGKASADVSLVDTGVALTREIQQHPVNINLFASQITLPSFERMDEFGVVKVF